MTVSERIKEEMKYTNEINDKVILYSYIQIKNLENKSKIKKSSNINKQMYFDFQNEMNYLKEKQ